MARSGDDARRYLLERYRPRVRVSIRYTAPLPTTNSALRPGPANARFCGCFGNVMTPSVAHLPVRTPARPQSWRRRAAPSHPPRDHRRRRRRSRWLHSAQVARRASRSRAACWPARCGPARRHTPTRRTYWPHTTCVRLGSARRRWDGQCHRRSGQFALCRELITAEGIAGGAVAVSGTVSVK